MSSVLPHGFVQKVIILGLDGIQAEVLLNSTIADDSTFTPSLRHEAEAIFAARKDKPEYIDYEFKDYKGTVHGFAARPNLGLPEIRDAFERSLEQTTAWFNKTL